MACEPCKNFKCKYEHQKLIEKVRELEKEKKTLCEKCAMRHQFEYDIECLCERIRLLKEHIENISIDNTQLTQKYVVADEKYIDVNAQLEKSNKRIEKLKIGLAIVGGCLAVSLIFLAHALLGG